MAVEGAIRVFLFISFLVFLPVSKAAATVLTYHGRILKHDGTPLEGPIEFKIQIWAANQNCLLYEAIRSQTVSNGTFALTIGDDEWGSSDTGVELEKVFQNRGTLTGVNCSYTPDLTDGRRLNVQFRHLTASPSTWEQVPETSINYVPLAIEAQSVGGFKAKQLLRIDDENGQAPSFDQSEADELKKLAQGISTRYLQSFSGGGVLIPGVSGDPLTPPPGTPLPI